MLNADTGSPGSGDRGLALTDLRFAYGRKPPAIDGLTARFEPGVIAVLGPNGAGKSTLFRLLAGAREPDAGSCSFDGRSPWESRTRQKYLKDLGYLPQQIDVFGGYTCTDLLRYVAWMREVPVAEVEGAIARCLAQVDLAEQCDAKVKTLSGGMRRRLGLAQAIVSGPRLVLLDEPTAGLDPGQRVRFLELVRALSAECSIVLATHLVDDVVTCADQVLMLMAGRAAFAGPLTQLGAREGAVVTAAEVQAAYLERTST